MDCLSLLRSTAFISLLPLTSAMAQSQQTTIATCGSSEGYSYYPLTGLVSKKSAGWQQDRVSAGEHQHNCATEAGRRRI